jgi:putative copper export protein
VVCNSFVFAPIVCYDLGRWHLVLSIGILPQAIKTKDVTIIVNFESIYEKIGIPSLVGQILTGIVLFLMRVENYSVLLRWDDFIGRHFILKILLLLFTIGLAIHARLRIVPKLNKENLNILAIHIIAVSIVGVLFVLVGMSIRLGIF